VAGLLTAQRWAVPASLGKALMTETDAYTSAQITAEVEVMAAEGPKAPSDPYNHPHSRLLVAGTMKYPTWKPWAWRVFCM